MAAACAAIGCGNTPCHLTVAEAFATYFRPTDEPFQTGSPAGVWTRWRPTLEAAGDRAYREKGFVVLSGSAPARLTDADPVHLPVADLRRYAMAAMVSINGGRQHYNSQFSPEFPRPYLRLRFPELDGNKAFDLNDGQGVVIATPAGDTFLLYCQRGKWSPLYTEYSTNRKADAPVSDWERRMITPLQGIFVFHHFNLRLPKAWREVEDAGADLWRLPDDPSGIVSLPELHRDDGGLQVTLFPATPGEFGFVIAENPAGGDFEGEDLVTETAAMMAGSLAMVVWKYTWNHDPPRAGTSFRAWGARFGPVNPDALLWKHLVSDTVFTETQTKALMTALRPGQVFVSESADQRDLGIHWYALKGQHGRPGSVGFWTSMGRRSIR